MRLRRVGDRQENYTALKDYVVMLGIVDFNNIVDLNRDGDGG